MLIKARRRLFNRRERSGVIATQSEVWECYSEEQLHGVLHEDLNDLNINMFPIERGNLVSEISK